MFFCCYHVWLTRKCRTKLNINWSCSMKLAMSMIINRYCFVGSRIKDNTEGSAAEQHHSATSNSVCSLHRSRTDLWLCKMIQKYVQHSRLKATSTMISMCVHRTASTRMNSFVSPLNSSSMQGGHTMMILNWGQFELKKKGMEQLWEQPPGLQHA